MRAATVVMPLRRRVSARRYSVGALENVLTERSGRMIVESTHRRTSARHGSRARARASAVVRVPS